MFSVAKKKKKSPFSFFCNLIFMDLGGAACRCPAGHAATRRIWGGEGGAQAGNVPGERQTGLCPCSPQSLGCITPGIGTCTPGERARIRLNSAEIGAPPGRLLWGLAQGSGAHPAPAPWFQALDPLGDPSPVVPGERGARTKPVGSG